MHLVAKRRRTRVITIFLLVVVAISLLWLGGNIHLLGINGLGAAHPAFLWLVHTPISRTEAITMAKNCLSNPRQSVFWEPFSKGYIHVTADPPMVRLYRLNPPVEMSETDRYQWRVELPAEVVTPPGFPMTYKGYVIVLIGADSGQTIAGSYNGMLGQWRLVYDYPPTSQDSPF
ncbi:MAG: hypothetical protein ABFD13_04715 [Candidatus Cryosericum sp.]|nr:hypothetical protein [bacterium]